MCFLVCFLVFSRHYLQNFFFPMTLTTFLTSFSKGESRKYAGHEGLLNRVSNLQAPGHDDKLSTGPLWRDTRVLEYNMVSLYRKKKEFNAVSLYRKKVFRIVHFRCYQCFDSKIYSIHMHVDFVHVHAALW